jgi:hypothetical protein
MYGRQVVERKYFIVVLFDRGENGESIVYTKIKGLVGSSVLA